MIQQSLDKPISTSIIHHRPLNWIEHAENHFNNGISYDASFIMYADEILMYLCIMANEGMFD
jgi:hypothetical protein